MFASWRDRQARPAICKLTDERRDLVRVRLALGYDVEDFLLLVRYAFESPEPGPRWWRGENPSGKKYLDLASLLRREKLAGRVEAARAWLDRIEERERENVGGRFRLVVDGPHSGTFFREDEPPPALAGLLALRGGAR